MAVQAAQLTAYYHPQSPLEHLQIQRIARCAAKLETLYAIEQSKIALVQMQSHAVDDQCMAQFDHYPASARRLALRQLQQNKLELPFGLTENLLDQICHEIDIYFGVVETESDLKAAFPKLCKFLQLVIIEGYSGPFSLDHRLWAVALLLRTSLSSILDESPVKAATGADRVDQLLKQMHSSSLLKDSIRKGVRPRSATKSTFIAA